MRSVAGFLLVGLNQTDYCKQTSNLSSKAKSLNYSKHKNARDREFSRLSLVIYSKIFASLILSRRDSRLARRDSRLERNETRGGNLLLSGTVILPRILK